MLRRMLSLLLSFMLITGTLPWSAISGTTKAQAAATVGTDDFYGVLVGNDTDVAKAIPALKELGVKWVRVWFDIADWSQPPASLAPFQKAVDLKKAGFHTIVEFNALNGIAPSGYAQAKAYFDAVQAITDSTGTSIKEYIDIWEILNELNLDKYWSGTPEQYVNDVLKAAWDSLKTPGSTELILGGNWTAWQLNPATGQHDTGVWTTEAYIQAGYLNYVDYAGFHPYTNNLEDMKLVMKAALALFGSKPVILSEWNFKQYADHDRWADDLEQARAWLYDRVAQAHMYRLLQSSGEGGWPGLLHNDAAYSPVEPFHSMYKHFPKQPQKVEAELLPASSASPLAVIDQTSASGGKVLRAETVQAGDAVQLTVTVPDAGVYRIGTLFSGGPQSGQVQLAVNGLSRGPAVELYRAQQTDAVYAGHGELELSAGAHTFTYTAIGRHLAAAGMSMIIDRIDLAKLPSGTTVDTTAPAPVTGQQASYRTDTAVELRWEASAGAAGYAIYRNGALAGTTRTGLQFTDRGLAPDTEYRYKVFAFDAAGNLSPAADIVTRTYNGPDVTPPSVPTGLTAASPTPASVKLTWSASVDDRSAPEYKVYRNGEWMSTVQQPAYEDRSMLSGTVHTYAISAVDREGNASSVSAGIAVEVSSFDGFQIGSDTRNVPATVPYLNDIGVKWVRVWSDIKQWSNPAHPDNQSIAFQQAVQFKREGFRVILMMNAHNGVIPSSYAEAKAYFDWLKSQHVDGMPLTEAIDIWEVGNELNLEKYWAGTPEQYVNRMLKAAWDSIKIGSGGSGQILGANWTAWQDGKYGTTITKSYIDAGYLNYVDYAGFHPYVDDLQTLQSVMNSALQLFQGKPVILSEWNWKSGTKTSLHEARAWLYDKVYLAIFYRFVSSSAEGGWVGPVANLGTQQQPLYEAHQTFYPMYKNWTGSSLLLEAESLKTAVSSGDRAGDYESAGTSGGSYNVFNANAVGDYVSYTVHVPVAGVYTVGTMFTRDTRSGIYQLQIEPKSGGGTASVVGAPFDMYGSWLHNKYAVHGKVSLSAGPHAFKYVVTGKHASATDYDGRFDRIDLTLQPAPNGLPAAPVLTNVRAENGQIIASWQPADQAESYRVHVGTASGVYSQTLDAGNGLSLTVNGLSNNASYYVAVTAMNRYGTSALSNERSAAPAGETEITGVLAGSSAVQITWKAIANITGYKLKYGTASGQYTTALSIGASTNTATVTDLTDGQTYYFTVSTISSVDGTESGNAAEAAATPLRIGENLLGNAGFEAGSLPPWQVRSDSSGIVSIRSDITNSGAYSAHVNTRFTGFEQIIEGLYPNTIYTVKAHGRVQVNGENVTLGVKNYGGPEKTRAIRGFGVFEPGTIVFKTGPSSTSANIYVWKSSASGTGGAFLDDFELVQSSYPDIEPPTAPTGLTATGISGSDIQLVWEPSSDNVAVKEYRIYRNGVRVRTTAATSVIDSGLPPLTAFTYTVEAVDTTNNVSAMSAAVTASTLAGELEPPTVPTNVTAVPVSSTQMDLAWQASTDNVGVAGYRIYRDGVMLATSSSTFYQDRNLMPGTVYVYRIQAFDLAGNLSELSLPVQGVTMEGEPPTIPQGLIAEATDTDRIRLHWIASQDNTGVAGYRIYRDGSEIGTAAVTEYIDAGLQPSTEYTYTVSAYDAAGNGSAPSAAVTATTLGKETLVPAADAWVGSTGSYNGTQNTLEAKKDSNEERIIYMKFDLSQVTGHSVKQASLTLKRYVWEAGVSRIALYSAASDSWTESGLRWGNRPELAEPLATAANAATLQLDVTDFINLQLAGDRVATIAVKIEEGSGRAAFYSREHASRPTLELNGLSIAGNPVPDTIAPTAPGSVMATALSHQSAVVTWTAATDNVGVVSYVIQRNGQPLTSVGADTLSYTDLAAAPSTAYVYGVSAVDGAGNASPVAYAAAVTTPPAPQQPLSMELKPAADSFVDSAAPNGNYGTNNILENSSTRRSFLKFGLAEVGGNRVAKAELVLKRYVWESGVSLIGVYGVADTSWTETGIKWSNMPVVAEQPLAVAGNAATVKLDITEYVNVALSAGASELSMATLLAGGTGRAGFYSRNHSTAGNHPLLMLTGIETVDRIPPSVPANVTATALNHQSVQVSWSASTDNTAVASYRIYRNDELLQEVVGTATTWTDETVQPLATYSYRVRAVDAAGNVSASSLPAEAATPAAPDITPPAAPTGLTVTEATYSLVSLTWIASTDNVGVTAYRIYRNTVKLAEIDGTTTHYSDSSVQESLAYTYTVSAVDAAGNESVPSSAVITHTPAKPVSGPAAPASLEGRALNHQVIQIHWSASPDEAKLTGYAIYRNGIRLDTSRGKSNRYTDNRVDSDTTYEYTVRAIDEFGKESQAGPTLRITTPKQPGKGKP